MLDERRKIKDEKCFELSSWKPVRSIGSMALLFTLVLFAACTDYQEEFENAFGALEYTVESSDSTSDGSSDSGSGKSSSSVKEKSSSSAESSSAKELSSNSEKSSHRTSRRSRPCSDPAEHRNVSR